ncbi:hypothetical protein BOX15_Mlig002964g2, partial [Macrostomum lignano]
SKQPANSSDAEAASNSDDFRVHRVNFHRPDLHPVNCAAYKSGRLAVARADASVEIYSERDGFYLDRRVPGCLLKSVEGLCWLNGRLFCTGLSGFVYEIDLASCDVRRSVSSHTDGNWCIAGQSASGRLAVGSDSGAVVALETEDDDLRLGATLGRLSGRVLSLAWHRVVQSDSLDSSDGGAPALAAGSVNCIFLLSGRPGDSAARRLPLARRGRRIDTLAWSVLFLGDALVSGDSAGCVTIWDSISGAQVRLFHSHRADVLALAPTRDRQSFFAAGVDPTVQRFDLVTQLPDTADTNDSSGPVLPASRWEMAWSTRELSHDVRALCCSKRHLVTGGTNCRLVLFELASLRQHQHQGRWKNRRRRCKIRLGWPLTFAPRPAASIRCCCPGPLALMRNSDRIRLYRLGDTEARGRDGLAGFAQLDSLPLSAEPRLLLELLPPDGQEVICADVGHRGSRLVYSDAKKLRLFELVDQPVIGADAAVADIGLRPVRLPLPEAADQPALSVCFTEAGYLLCLGRDRQLRCLSSANGALLGSARPSVADGAVTAHLLAGRDRLAALGTHEGHVLVYGLPDCGQLAQLGRGRRCCQPTAMAMHPSKRKLFVAYSDRSIALYDVDKQAANPWCMNFNAYVSPEWHHLGHFLHAVYASPGKVLLANDRFLVSISLYRTVPSANIFRPDAPTVYRKPPATAAEDAKQLPVEGDAGQQQVEEIEETKEIVVESKELDNNDDDADNDEAAAATGPEADQTEPSTEASSKKSHRQSSRMRKLIRKRKHSTGSAADTDSQPVAEKKITQESQPPSTAPPASTALTPAQSRRRRRRQVSVSEAGDDRPKFSLELSAGQSSAVAWVSGFQFLLGLCQVSKRDLCLVSLPPEDYLAMLQAPAFRKRFGV